MSAWHNGVMPLGVSRLINYGSDMSTTPNRLETRLVTIMTMTIHPSHVAVIPIVPLHTPCAPLTSPQK